MNILRLVSSLLAILVSLPACIGADGDAMPLGTGNARCTEQGLCMHLVGKRSLQGAFRDGDDEIKFDILHRPYHGFSVGGVYPWCMRLVDQKSQQFFFHDNGHCPKSWYEKTGLVPPWQGKEDPGFDRRDDLANVLQTTLQVTQAPHGRERALQELRESVDSHLKSVQTAKNITAGQHLKHRIDRGESEIDYRDEEVLRSAARIAMAHEEDEALEEADLSLEETQNEKIEPGDESSVSGELTKEEPLRNSANEDADEDEWPLASSKENKTNRVNPELGYFENLASRTPPPISFFSWGSSDGVPKTSPEEVIVNPDLEYKQHITLFSKPVKRRLAWGRETKKHHTAAYIEVFARARGSRGEFKKIQEDYTANHGSSPKSHEMKEYDHCTDTPVTYGRTVWKGECSGKWGILRNQHLCNDDTRLQIRNAYNIASNKNCEHVDHFHRPWCATR